MILALVLTASMGAGRAIAQNRIVIVQVSDAQGHPLSGVRIGPKGKGDITDATDIGGRAQLKLAAQTRVESAIPIMLVDEATGRDLVFMQPWDGYIRVPPFDNDSEYVISIVLIPRRLRQYIENGGQSGGSVVTSLQSKREQRETKKVVKQH
jgi:hypothetical protein